MHAKTLFRLLLKAVGVWVTVLGVTKIPAIVAQLLLTRGLMGGATAGAFLPWAFSSVVEIAIGLYLFFGGEAIVRLAVPSNRPCCPECGYDISGLDDGGMPRVRHPSRRGCSVAEVNADHLSVTKEFV